MAEHPTSILSRLDSQYETLSGDKFGVTFDHEGYHAVTSLIV